MLLVRSLLAVLRLAVFYIVSSTFHLTSSIILAVFTPVSLNALAMAIALTSCIPKRSSSYNEIRVQRSSKRTSTCLEQIKNVASNEENYVTTRVNCGVTGSIYVTPYL